MTVDVSQREFRWDPYFSCHGEDFYHFWKSYLGIGEKDILYVLGCGFDLRMCSGYKAITEAGGKGKRDCLLIKFNEGPESSSEHHRSLIEKNMGTLEILCKGRGDLITEDIEMWSNDGIGRHRIGSRTATEVFKDMSLFNNYTDVIIDIGSLPKSIYLSLIGKALYLLDNFNRGNGATKIINLHVVVHEDAELDKNIKEVGIDDMITFVHGFGAASLTTERSSNIPMIWIPVFGEDQRPQLDLLYRSVNPTEICPVIPSPSRNPRRGDALFIEYHDILFDAWSVEPRNIIYASEYNPFDGYRQIYRTIIHYNQALNPLGGCKAIISVVSSKLISIGGLLAAYELIYKSGIEVGLALVEAQGYQFAERDLTLEGELYSLWLIGEPYE